MALSEEYYQRRGLKTPLVVHTVSHGSLLLRRQGWRDTYTTPWLLLRVNWVPHAQRPGHYSIRFQTPSHDSYAKRDPWSSLGDPMVCEYGEFENYIVTWATQIKAIRAPVSRLESTLDTWSVFCHCFDGYLSRHASARLLAEIESSLDPMGAIGVRYNFQQVASERLQAENLSAFEKWESNFLPFALSNLDWLGRIVNGD